MSFISKIINLLFGKKKTTVEPTPAPVEAKPVELPTQPVEVKTEEPAPAPAPTRVKKTVNQGNPANPDWDYIWDNLVADDTKIAKELLDYNVKMYLKHRDKMIEVEKRTGVPQWFVAGLTMREMGWDMNGCLHNGDPWNKVTRNVPRGLGPWSSWVEAAVDALAYDKVTPDKVNTIAKACKKAFEFNGVGYKTKIGDHGVTEYSPYCVAYSNFHDETSKYKSDGKYDPNAPEKQMGVVTFWKELERLGYMTLP